MVKRPVLPEPPSSPAPSTTLQPYDAYDFELLTREGKAVSLADYAKAPLVLIFYLGGTCPFCVKQLTLFDEVAEQFEQELGARILAVSSSNDQDIELLRENFLHDRNRPLRLDTVSGGKELKIFQDYGAFDTAKNEPLHGLFLIDKQGRVVWRDISHHAYTDVSGFLKEAQRLLRP